MGAWHDFVKEVQEKEGCSYKEALQKASPLWKAKKAGKSAENDVAEAVKPKKRRKTKKTKGQPTEQQDFPKVAKRKQKRVRIAKTTAVPLTNLGGSLIPQDVLVKKPRGRRRLRKKRTVRYDTDAMFLKQKLRV